MATLGDASPVAALGDIFPVATLGRISWGMHGCWLVGGDMQYCVGLLVREQI